MHNNSAKDWQAYWQGNQAVDRRDCSGTDHPAVTQFWHKFFVLAGKCAANSEIPLQVLDVASGGGAIIGHASKVLGAAQVSPFCIDISASAVKSTCAGSDGARGIVADAAHWPLATECMDVVASQFGVEYAGLAAISDMSQSVRSGGSLGLLLHYRNGAIHRECSANLQGIAGLEQSRFIDQSMEMFRDAFAVLRGEPRAAYEASSQALIPTFRKLEGLMAEFGQNVANGLLLQVYKDVDHIHTNLPKFDPADVQSWLQGLKQELAGFSGRMQSMCDAAVDQREFQEVLSQLEVNGFDVLDSAPLVSDQHDMPLAWSVMAARR